MIGGLAYISSRAMIAPTNHLEESHQMNAEQKIERLNEIQSEIKVLQGKLESLQGVKALREEMDRLMSGNVNAKYIRFMVDEDFQREASEAEQKIQSLTYERDSLLSSKVENTPDLPKYYSFHYEGRHVCFIWEGDCRGFKKDDMGVYKAIHFLVTNCRLTPFEALTIASCFDSTYKVYWTICRHYKDCNGNAMIHNFVQSNCRNYYKENVTNYLQKIANIPNLHAEFLKYIG